MEEEETRRQGVPLGRRLHSLYDNKWWKILWQVWQIQTWLLTYKKYEMLGLKIATKRSNLGVRGSHSNWGKNWSMKRKTSVMRVTKPLRWVGGSHGGKLDLTSPHEVNKMMSWGSRITFYHFLIGFWHFWRGFGCPLHGECTLTLLVNQFRPLMGA